MNKITIIGTGNVATHLCIALAGKVDELINISSREPEEIPTDSDIYIIAVSDRAITEVASKMPGVAGVVAHTAGSVSIDVLKPYFDNIGVFYPLQTFTKGAYLDYSAIPMFIEGNNAATEGMLMGVASLFTSHLQKADSQQRRTLHLASVFACNFANCLWSITNDILRTEHLDFDVLLPLIDTSVSKLKYLDPEEAQTGPAARGDTQVIDIHLNLLKNPEYKQIYSLLSQSIIKNIRK
ncbi:MAG: DUF2520 domain-containing protein [Prevotella sp.]|nr:DUF2520 domain-containing protein [Prevotella sp.]MCM1075289.1 DUF2520 domain-containing protein [Ruminococcus sp.]